MSNEERVCRLCLTIFDFSYRIIDEASKHMINVLLLNLELSATEDPVMCSSCVEKLQKFFDFKTSCIQANDPLRLSPANENTSIYYNVCHFCKQCVEKELFVSVRAFEKTSELMRDMLVKCMPELNFSSVADFVICKHCLDSINGYFSLMMTCQSVEEKIMENRNSESAIFDGKIKLSKIVQKFSMKIELSNRGQSDNVNVIKKEENLNEKDEVVNTAIKNEYLIKEEQDFRTEVDAYEIESDSSTYSESTKEDFVDDQNSLLKISNPIPKLETFNKEKVISPRKVRRTVCRYCRENVTHFQRHLMRNHKNEDEVQRFMKFPINSKERRDSIGLLRNEGHFQEFMKGNIIPSSKRSSLTPAERYVPCGYCKGIFLKPYLARHSKNCKARVVQVKREEHLSESQTLIAACSQFGDVLSTMRITSEVLKTMKPDYISLVAKTDPLIVHFGEDHLRGREGLQIVSSCSSKIRELARLLIAYRQKTGNGQSTFKDMLDLNEFQQVVGCARLISGYDEVKQTYASPSLFVHLGTSLKRVCDVYLELLQRKSWFLQCEYREERSREVKRFRKLVQAQWTMETDSTACKKEEGGSKLGGRKKSRAGRASWSQREKEVVLKYFEDHIKTKKAPRKRETLLFKAQHPELFEDKDWVKIKIFVYNQYRVDNE